MGRHRILFLSSRYIYNGSDWNDVQREAGHDVSTVGSLPHRDAASNLCSVLLHYSSGHRVSLGKYMQTQK